MPVEYRKAQAVRDVAMQTVIPEYHPDKAGLGLGFLFASELPIKGGKQTMGKIKKASPIERCLDNDSEFFVIIDETIWDSITEDQQIALVDHELCHLESKENDEGEAVWFLRGHDVEEFVAVIERHGAWKQDVEEFIAAAKTVQLPLFEEKETQAETTDSIRIAQTTWI